MYNKQKQMEPSFIVNKARNFKNRSIEDGSGDGNKLFKAHQQMKIIQPVVNFKMNSPTNQSRSDGLYSGASVKDCHLTQDNFSDDEDDYSYYNDDEALKNCRYCHQCQQHQYNSRNHHQNKLVKYQRPAMLNNYVPHNLPNLRPSTFSDHQNQKSVIVEYPNTRQSTQNGRDKRYQYDKMQLHQMNEKLTQQLELKQKLPDTAVKSNMDSYKQLTRLKSPKQKHSTSNRSPKPRENIEVFTTSLADTDEICKSVNLQLTGNDFDSHKSIEHLLIKRRLYHAHRIIEEANRIKKFDSFSQKS